jgi:hypothetical protein
MGVNGPNGFHDFFKNFRLGNNHVEKMDDTAILDYVGDVKYGITKKELDYIHKNSGLSGKQLAEFDKAVENGTIGEFIKKLDSTDLQNSLGVSLSSTVGKTDATKDIEEAKRLAEFTDSDCDMNLVMSYIENAGASVARVGQTTTNTFKIAQKDDPVGKFSNRNSDVFERSWALNPYFNDNFLTSGEF